MSTTGDKERDDQLEPVGWRVLLAKILEAASAAGGAGAGSIGGPPGVLIGAALANTLGSQFTSRYVETSGRKLVAVVRGLQSELEVLSEKYHSLDELFDEEKLLAAAARLGPEIMASANWARVEFLSKAMLNAGLGVAGNATDKYLSIVQRLDVDHVFILDYLSKPHPEVKKINPQQLVSTLKALLLKEYPELNGEISIALPTAIQEVVDLGFTMFPRVIPAMLQPGQEKVYELMGPRLSPLGGVIHRFFRDVQPPEETNVLDHD